MENVTGQKSGTVQKDSKSSSQRHPLDAVPSHAPDVEVRPSRGSGLHLKRSVAVAGPIASRLPARWTTRYREAMLDRHGAEFWNLVDGNRSLRDIADALSQKLSTSEDEAREATILFTRTLMERHLIFLALPTDVIEEPGK